jgi:hypothetical protein
MITIAGVYDYATIPYDYVMQDDGQPHYDCRSHGSHYFSHPYHYYRRQDMGTQSPARSIRVEIPRVPHSHRPPPLAYLSQCQMLHSAGQALTPHTRIPLGERCRSISPFPPQGFHNCHPQYGHHTLPPPSAEEVGFRSAPPEFPPPPPPAENETLSACEYEQGESLNSRLVPDFQ